MVGRFVAEGFDAVGRGISLQERGPDGSERRKGLVGYGSVGLVVYLVLIGLISCSASLGL